VLRAKLSLTEEQKETVKSLYATIESLSVDEKLDPVQDKTVEISDSQRYVFNHLRSAIGDMRCGSARNLLRNGQAGRPTHVEISMYLRDSEGESKVIGSCRYDLAEAYRSHKLHCKWVDLNGDAGSVRLCFYYNKEGIAPEPREDAHPERKKESKVERKNSMVSTGRNRRPRRREALHFRRHVEPSWQKHT